MTTEREPDPIAAFYEHHPYPPPIDDLDRYRRGWADGRLRRIEHHRRWPSAPFRDDHSILIAGCGTSQAAKYAARYPNARVTGIDASATSIEQTRRLAERYRLDNLDLRLMAIEDVGQLDESFDQVVCTGVLHHLAEPEVGLRALRDVLAPQGALDAMLYAPYGRTGVYMIQEYCRMLGVRPEPGDIDDLVASLRELPTGHPLGPLLRNTPDFANDDALADALLNPRDQAYSVPGVFALLAGTGFQFDRWIRQAPYRPQCGVLGGLPHGERIAVLPIEQQFAALELYRGTMVRHSFIAHRDDDPPTTIRFDGEAWGGYVPIRTANSVAVQERLPAGVAAALLNRAHTYPDLILFATEEQQRRFELIDGQRTIDEIAADAAFFERLWWHDLIVIDASAQRCHE